MVYTFVIAHSVVVYCSSVPLGHNIRKTPASSLRAQTHCIPLVGSGSNRSPFQINQSRNSQLSMTYKTMRYVSCFDYDSVPDAIYKLSILFSRSTSIPQGCWIQLGTALRMAQEVGAHRRRPLTAPTAENEHRKRAFWSLLQFSQPLSLIRSPGCFSHWIVRSARSQAVSVSYRMESKLFAIWSMSWVSGKAYPIAMTLSFRLTVMTSFGTIQIRRSILNNHQGNHQLCPSSTAISVCTIFLQLLCVHS